MSKLAPLSEEDPRIIDNTEIFFTKNLYPIIALIALLFVLVCAGTWWVVQQKATEEKAFALYSGAKTPEDKLAVITAYPKSKAAALALIELAQKEGESKNYDAALAHYRTFLKNFPKHPFTDSVTLAVAITLENAGKFSESQAAYADIIAAKPEHAFTGAASIGLARIYLQENKLLAARQALSDFISAHEDGSSTNEAREMLNSLPPAIK